MFYAEFRAALPEPSDEGGYGWVYDTSMLLLADAAPTTPQCIGVRERAVANTAVTGL
jgi:hypothetical protein